MHHIGFGRGSWDQSFDFGLSMFGAGTTLWGFGVSSAFWYSLKSTKSGLGDGVSATGIFASALQRGCALLLDFSEQPSWFESGALPTIGPICPPPPLPNLPESISPPASLQAATITPKL